MFRNDDSSINISSLYSWYLITFSMKSVIMRIWHSRLDNNLQCFLLSFYFFSITIFAFVFLLKDLTTRIAFFTSDLNLTVHSRSYLRQLDCNSLSFTSSALNNILTSLSITITADSISRYSYLFYFTCIDLLQSYLNFNKFWLGFSWTIIFLSLLEDIK